MRTYPTNSPEAAARIVALALISDGNVCKSEISVLRHLDAERELGLPAGAFSQVMLQLCEDLVAVQDKTSAGMCTVDSTTLTALLSEVDEPEIQAKVLRLTSAATEADGHLTETEATLVGSALLQWKMGCVVA